MKRPNLHSIILAAAVTLIPAFATVQADAEIESAARQYLSNHARSWLDNPIVIDAVKQQNLVNADLSQADVDQLDKTWRSEASTGSGPMIDSVLGKALSSYLKTVQDDSNGLITEVFVMDNKGLNVGQSSVTSDFWQGDEGKWQNSYLKGPNALFVDDVELDDSSQRFQVQVSVPVVDPASGKAIGAVTIGIDAEGLLML